MKFEEDMTKLIEEVMTKDNLITARRAPPLPRQRRYFRSIKLKSCP